MRFIDDQMKMNRNMMHPREQILDALADPKTVLELREELGLRRALIYKYIYQLKNLGFIQTVGKIYTSGRPANRYQVT